MIGTAAFTIRRATVADVPVLAALAARTFRETYLPYDNPDEIDAYNAEHFSEEAVAGWFRGADQVVLVACEAGTCIGYAHVARTPVPTCVVDRDAVELHRFYLDTLQIGRGRGRALFDAVLLEATAMGHATMWLLVYEKNSRARGFYHHLGFREVGTAVFVFGGVPYHDPVMQLSLVPTST